MVTFQVTRMVNKGPLPFEMSGSGPAHDRWFRDRMREALAGLENGSNTEIGEAEWRKIAERKRAEIDGLASKDR